MSRRHALVVNQADGVRVLDDRSLNGVYVNGERVDWAPLTDGDEIAVVVLGFEIVLLVDSIFVALALVAIVETVCKVGNWL